MPDAEDVARFNGRQTRYHIEAAIGHGGMAAVYSGRDTTLDRPIAIKLFRSSAASNEELRGQQQEARLLASFAHHSLVRLFDVGVDFLPDGRPRIFLVMELIDGLDLRVRLRRGTLPLLHVAHIAYDLAEGLAYLHANGVAHRDIKPANVLLVRGPQGRRPRVKLADFGIAEMEGHVTPSDETAGTAAYLSPEQAAGEDVSYAADVYSLGLVLLEAITGRTEFPGRILESAFSRLDRDPAIPPSLPPEWADILSAMTQRLAPNRPSAAEAAEAFRKILIDEVRASEQEQVSVAVTRPSIVRRYNVLAQGEDPELDRLALLSARLTASEGAVVAIADEDRVLVRGRHGTVLGGARGHEYVSGVLEEQAVEHADLQRDDASRWPPLVAGADGVAAYASAPIRTHDGHAIGAVAVFSSVPRAFTDADRATLHDIAEMAMHEIELRRAVRRLVVPGRRGIEET